MTTIAPAPRRIAGGGGGGGSTLATPAHDGQVWMSKAAATTGNISVNEPWLWSTDPRVGLVADGTTNNKPLLDAAYALMPNGGQLRCEPGVFAMSQASTVPNGVQIVGAGGSPWWGNGPSAAPVLGTIFKATAGSSPFILGTTISGNADGGAALRDLAVFAYANGGGTPPNGVLVNGDKARMRDCVIYGGATAGVNIAGHGFAAYATDVLMNNGGSAWLCASNDAHIYNSVTQGYLYGINLTGGGVYVTGGHFFTAAISGSNDIRITGSGAQILGATFENCMSDFIAIIPPAGTTCTAITVSSHFYAHSASRPADTAGFIRMDATAAGSAITGVTVGGSTVDVTNRDLYIAKALGNVSQWSISGINHTHAQHILAPGSLSPDAGMSLCSVNTSASAGGNVLRSENRGLAAFVGDGSSGPFTVTHKVDGPGGTAPRYATVTPASDAARAAGTPVVTLNATTLSINTSVSPAVGADLQWYWEVEA